MRISQGYRNDFCNRLAVGEMTGSGHSATSTDVRYQAAFGATADISPASYPLGHPRSR
jgi:hypothetical protein